VPGPHPDPARTDGTTYQLAVYVGLDARGCQRYRYETVRGSRRDAERRLAELVTAAGIGDLATNGSIRFGEFVNAWWEVSTNDLSPNTHIGYRGLLDRYLLPEFRNRRLDRIGPADLERLYGQLLDGAAPGLARPLSAVTVYKVHSLASGLMATGVRWCWIQNNPAGRAKPPRARLTPVGVPSVDDVIRNAVPRTRRTSRPAGTHPPLFGPSPFGCQFGCHLTADWCMTMPWSALFPSGVFRRERTATKCGNHWMEAATNTPTSRLLTPPAIAAGSRSPSPDIGWTRGSAVRESGFRRVRAQPLASRTGFGYDRPRSLGCRGSAKQLPNFVQLPVRHPMVMLVVSGHASLSNH
jgi:hypothetical protein